MMFQIRRHQTLIVGVVFGLLLIFNARSQAAGVVAVCDEASLDAALAGGGTLSFTCSGTITLTATKVVGANTIIDGAGQAVTISGGGAVSIFRVNPGVALTLRNLTIADGLNVGPVSQGGAIFNDAGTVTLNNSILTGHQAAFGGAIYNQGGTVTILSSTLTGNLSVLNLGGAIFSSGNLTVTNSTISNNTGHGIYNYGGTVTVTNSTLSGNTSGSGAAINNALNGTTTISGSTISGNTALAGGGIDNNDIGGTLTVTNSSFVGNVANGALGSGGAIVINFGTVVIVNSTFANNQASYVGGGVYNAASVTITNSTFVGNQAANGGGGFWNALGTGTIRNTIIANSPTGANCFVGGGTVNGTMNNLDDDGSCPGFTQVTPAGLNLGGLTGNPAYFLLLPGSVAIDAGSNGACPSTDQRGQARPTDGNLDGTSGCDVGAYEADGPLLQPAVAVAAEAPLPLCSDLDGSVHPVVRAILPQGVYGIYCRIIAENRVFTRTSAEVGVQSLLDLGVIHAVDVFTLSDVNAAGTRICLQGTGAMYFLDAAGAPRVPQRLPTTVQDGFTCVVIPNVGAVVLVGSSDGASETLPTSNTPLSGCRVTTLYRVNLRAEPNTTSEIITMLPYNTTYQGTEHVPGWYRVVYRDAQGWLSESLVTTQGECDE
jgi:hypothetical protein